MDQSAEEISTAKAIKLDYPGDRSLAAWRRYAKRWPLFERAMRPVLAAMRHVPGEHALEITASNDDR